MADKAQILLHFSNSLYRKMLKAYPPLHRQRFSNEMTQVFRDLCYEIYSDKGLAGLLGLWTITFLDLTKTAFEARLKGATNMTKEKFVRLGGWALMLAGILMIFIFSWNKSFNDIFGTSEAYRSFSNSIWPILPLLYGIAFIAIRIHYKGQLGALGNYSLQTGIVFAFSAFAVSIMTLIVNGSFNDLYPSSRSLRLLAARLIGFDYLANQIVLTLFGIDAYKRQYLSRWWPIPLIAGLIPIFNYVLQNSINVWPRALWPLYRGLAYTPEIFGLGSFLLGYMLQKESKIAIKSS